MLYITKLNGMPITSTEQYKQQMTAGAAHALGIREMGIYRYNTANESAESRSRRFDGMIAGMRGGDTVICQFPTWNGLEFERALVRHIKAYHGRIVIFIHDLSALSFETQNSELQGTVDLYNEAEALIVPSCAMKQFLVRHGIRSGMKFIVQEMWDYTTRLNALGRARLKRELHFAGNPDGTRFPGRWEYEIPLKVYSDQDCQGSHVQKMGWIPPDRLLLELSKGGFGLVWYGNASRYQHLSMHNSLKLSACLAAGIPVIVPRGISNQYMIKENHLGIVADTLGEAAETIRRMTEQEYQDYAAAAAGFAPLLREGFFTRKCLVDAMHMLARDNMRIYSESTETYVLPECSFDYVCLNESYGGNLALSWTFRGEAEGFLVYDADSGKLVGEALNGLEHYLLLENYPKESRLIVKAYLRTLRGKMILAESDVAEVAEQHQKQAVVSLVIPAYNTEKYIARGIDTALAQSFQDMEIIIVNDGSTDQTQTMIEWYQARYPQIKSFYKANEGQAIARNLGAEYATGDYIGFMDSDDLMRPNMMERLYGSITKNDCDIAMTSVYQLVNGVYEKTGEYSMEEDLPVSVDDFLKLYIGYAYPVIWNKLYRSPLVKEHPLPKMTYEDSAWMPCVLSYAEKVCYIKEYLYDYDRTIRGNTYVQATLDKPMEEKFKDRKDYIMYFLNHGNPRRKNILKQLALGYAVGLASGFSYPPFKELLKEIEEW